MAPAAPPVPLTAQVFPLTVAYPPRIVCCPPAGLALAVVVLTLPKARLLKSKLTTPPVFRVTAPREIAPLLPKAGAIVDTPLLIVVDANVCVFAALEATTR